jgi:hypothetical protein
MPISPFDEVAGVALTTAEARRERCATDDLRSGVG